MAARIQVTLSLADCDQIAGGVVPGRLRDICVLFQSMYDPWLEWAGTQLHKRNVLKDETRCTSKNNNWKRKAENWIVALGHREWELKSLVRANRKPKRRSETWEELINKMERDWRYLSNNTQGDIWDKWATNKAGISRKRAVRETSRASHCET